MSTNFELFALATGPTSRTLTPQQLIAAAESFGCVDSWWRVADEVPAGALMHLPLPGGRFMVCDAGDLVHPDSARLVGVEAGAGSEAAITEVLQALHWLSVAIVDEADRIRAQVPGGQKADGSTSLSHLGGQPMVTLSIARVPSELVTAPIVELARLGSWWLKPDDEVREGFDRYYQAKGEAERASALPVSAEESPR